MNEHLAIDAIRRGRHPCVCSTSTDKGSAVVGFHGGPVAAVIWCLHCGGHLVSYCDDEELFSAIMEDRFYEYEPAPPSFPKTGELNEAARKKLERYRAVYYVMHGETLMPEPSRRVKGASQKSQFAPAQAGDK